jgi:type II secretory pathway pseudopilin PulG
MRNLFGFMAAAALVAQPGLASAAPAAAPSAGKARTAGAVQARQQTVRLALLQGRRENSQGPANASQQGQNQANENSVLNDGQPQNGTNPGRANRTTVLSRVLFFAPAAAVGGLLIALAAGGGRGRPVSQ